jgi:hypothetical protein
MADSGRKNIKGFLQLGDGAGLRNNSGVIEIRNSTNTSNATLDAGQLRIGGTSIRDVSGIFSGSDYYALDKSLFRGHYVAECPITGCRVSKASSTQITVTAGRLTVPDSGIFSSIGYHFQHYYPGASNQSLSTIKLSGTASVGANQTWYIMLVRADSDASITLTADTSSSGANVASGYGYRIIGFLTTDGSGNIDKVWQHNQPDTCRVYNSANISITHNTLTVIDWDSERHDTNGMHSTSTNTSRITLQKGGQYFIELSVLFAAESAPNSIKIARILLNGSTLLAGQVHRSVGGGSVTQIISCSAMPYLQASDYIEAQVFQNTGASLNLLTTADVSNFGATLMEFH